MLLQDLASVIRSKNAGPRILTLDVICAGPADFERFARDARVAEEDRAVLGSLIRRSLEIKQAKFEHGEEPHRPCANDDHVRLVRHSGGRGCHLHRRGVLHLVLQIGAPL